MDKPAYRKAYMLVEHQNQIKNIRRRSHYEAFFTLSTQSQKHNEMSLKG